MKNLFLIFPAILLLISCEEHSASKKANEIDQDTIAAEIKLIGKLHDTCFLNLYYKDPGAFVTGEKLNSDLLGKGKVNSSVPGDYYLDYDFSDEAGNQSATVTRTVHVQANSTDFLIGSYDVACTCTAISVDPKKPDYSSLTYTAAVKGYPAHDHFELVNLNIGSEFVIPITFLKHNQIQVSFYRNGLTSASGTLAASRESFTIECKDDDDLLNTKYYCKNVFTKRKK